MGFVLIVDDEEHNRDILVRRLSKKGYQTLEAENGNQALELVDKAPIDLILLDIRMPVMNGNEVLEKIRKKYTSIELPVIMVTAEVDSSSTVTSLGLGANDYVTKPIDLPVLLARMASKLSERKLTKAKIEDNVLGTASDPQQIEALIRKGENHRVEFKSTLRWNIHSEQTGKEIKIAWMKTVVAFLNSDGGTLLVGINDEGGIVGTSLDKFKNNDKYLLHVNNCIKDFIGAEFVSHLSYDLVDMGNEKILHLECRPHPKPVFLKNGKDEEFYTRIGPGTVKLNAREILAYMQSKNSS